MGEFKYRINDDALIRYEPVANLQHIFYQGKVVITKEEFISCYNEWIGEKKDDLQ